MVEVKSSGQRRLSKNLTYFQERTGAEHALQLSMDDEFEPVDCFAFDYPVVVPARTFLFQLV